MWFLTIIFLVTAIYLLLKYVYSYWDRNGMPNIKPVIPFGNIESVAKGKRSFGLAMLDLYNKTKEPFIGIYLFFRPAILIRDPELVRKVLISDFSSFHDRGIYCNDEKDPFSATLLSLPGEKWKTLRSQLSPAFSSGRIKGMFETILKVGKCMDQHLDQFAVNNQVVDMRNIASRYAVDIIGNIIFGLEVNTLDDPDHRFYGLMKRLLNPSFKENLRSACGFVCPKIIEFFGIQGAAPFNKNFMIDIVTNTIEHRERNNVIRKDFMQLLLQLRNSGKLNEGDSWEIRTDSTQVKSLSIEKCAGEVFLFYFAGSDPSASTISFCLYELTKYPDYMETLQKEIDDVLQRNNNELTYDMLNEFKFLDLCIDETLRMYTGLPILNRECTKDFDIPEKNFTIKKGTPIIISIFGMHRDPELFKNPDIFDPYRFAEGNPNFNSKYYIPFGDGPHICIGIRMAQVVIKCGLIMLLSKYNFEAADYRKMEFEPNTITIVAKNGINLKLTKRF